MWQHFLRQLEQLEDRRDGEAVVESMSPEDLRLRIFVTDPAGHVAIEGQARTRSVRDLRWQFGAIPFDPTLLPPLLGGLCQVVRAIRRQAMSQARDHRGRYARDLQATAANAVVSDTTSHSRQRRRINVR